MDDERALYERVLAHMLACMRAAPLCAEPFPHLTFTDVFPPDVYAELLVNLPPATRYSTGPLDPNAPTTRTFYNLTAEGVRRLPVASRGLWRCVAAALTATELKRTLFAKLAPDLMRRFGVKAAKVPDLAGYPRPTLYRDTAGFVLAPHPDTPKKVVTMHVYLPTDDSQTHLGTSLYRQDATGSFTLVKQLPFRPNSGYAFVVNNSGPRPTWHGREALPDDAGVRHTLLNTFYLEPRDGYAGYLDVQS